MNAFNECERFKKIYFPVDSHLLSLSSMAFCKSGIELFIVPSSVRSVEENNH